MPTAGTVVIRIDADSAKLIREFTKAQLKAKKFQRSTGASLKKLSRSFNAFGIAAAGAIAVLATKQFVEAGVAMQGLDRAFKFATGSAEKGKKEFQFIREESERLGLVLDDTALAYAKLAAASKGTTLEGDNTREIFISIAEASRVLNLSAEQTKGALTAVEQIISKGKVSAEELRGQLGERLPGAFQIAARAIGVTVSELDKMLSTGRLLSEDFLPLFAKELRKTFSEDVASASEDAQSQFNRLATSIFEFKAVIAQSGLLDFLAELAEDTVTLADAVIKFANSLGFGNEVDIAKAEIAGIKREISALTVELFTPPRPGFGLLRFLGLEDPEKIRRATEAALAAAEAELLKSQDRLAKLITTTAGDDAPAVAPPAAIVDLSEQQAAQTALAIQQAQFEADEKLRIDQSLKAALLGSQEEQNIILTQMAFDLAAAQVEAEAEADAAARAALGLPPKAADPTKAAKDEAEARVEIAERLVKRMASLDTKAKTDAEKRRRLEVKKEADAARQRAKTAADLQNVFGFLAQSGSKKVAAVGKAAAIAQTIWSTAAGVMNAFRDLPYPAAVAASASILALGAGQLATIKGTNLGGGGGLGGALATPSLPTPDLNQPSFEDQFGDTSAGTQSSVQIIFQGDVIGWDEHIEERVIDSIRDVVEEQDVILISNNSRNALDLAEVVA